MPTPVSALIHAATLVTAGIYLMVRLGPFMAGSDLVILVGCLTAFMAGVFGFFQADLKRVIAFSTCSQLGYAQRPTPNANVWVSHSHLLFDPTNKCSKGRLRLRSDFKYLFAVSRGATYYRGIELRMYSTFVNIEVDIVPVSYVEKFESLTKDDFYQIKKKYKKVAGIYLWQNKTNGKCYIGRSANLFTRFENYFSMGYLTRVGNKMPICSALLKHGYGHFILYVLEVVPADRIDLLPHREDYFVTIVKPSYNIAKVLDRFVGQNHPRFGKVLAQEIRNKISKALTARKLSAVTIENHRKGAKKKPVYCYDAVSKELVISFESIRCMGRALDISTTLIYRKLDNDKLFYTFYKEKNYSWLLYTKPLG